MDVYSKCTSRQRCIIDHIIEMFIKVQVLHDTTGNIGLRVPVLLINITLYIYLKHI